jgi:hypothetical protein
MAELLRQFEPDTAKLQVLAECMDNYGIGDESAEWPNNIISRRAVVYGNGQIARRGEPVIFATDPDELALCEQLAQDAKSIAGEMEVGMGSESGDPFYAFFIAGDEATARPEAIDEALIRARFGGTIFPSATILVEPLRESGVWWNEVDRGDEGQAEDGVDYQEELRPWRVLIAWFNGRAEFVDTAFVCIGDYNALMELGEDDLPPGTEMTASVLPRLMLGLTRGGNVCGLFGWVVQT